MQTVNTDNTPEMYHALEAGAMKRPPRHPDAPFMQRLFGVAGIQPDSWMPVDSCARHFCMTIKKRRQQ